jgi:hypothetical protein
MWLSASCFLLKDFGLGGMGAGDGVSAFGLDDPLAWAPVIQPQKRSFDDSASLS